MQYPRRRASKVQATSKAEVGDNVATVGVRPSAGTVGLPIPQRNVQCMERSASLARRRGILSNSAGALSITVHKAMVVMAESPGRTCTIKIRMAKHHSRYRTMTQSMCELCISSLMSIIQLIITLPLMKSQVIGNLNILSQI